jgi:hypothetical protein
MVAGGSHVNLGTGESVEWVGGVLAMAHPAAASPWATTGARAVAPPRASRSTRPSGARAVKTRLGVALFDDLGHYVGVVTAPIGQLVFGRGADTVLLKRGDDLQP